MNVSVTPELERFVQDLVAAGRYASASEVFRDGLRLLEQVERRRLLEKALTEGLTPEEEGKVPAEVLAELRSVAGTKIQEGLGALERGDVVDGEEFFARWRARLGAATPSVGASPPVKRGA